jgi:hypothetical protein
VIKAQAQNVARKLTDTPANHMTPTIFAQVSLLLAFMLVYPTRWYFIFYWVPKNGIKKKRNLYMEEYLQYGGYDLTFQ